MNYLGLLLTVSGCIFLAVSLVILKNIILKSIKIQAVVKNSSRTFGEVLCISENEEQLGRAKWTSYTPSIIYKVDGVQYVLDKYSVLNPEPFFKGQKVVVIYNVNDPAKALAKLELNSNEYFNAELPLSPKSLLGFLITALSSAFCLYFAMMG